MRVAGLAEFIIDLDELYLGELLEVLNEWLGDVVQRAVRLTSAGKVDLSDTVGEHDTLVAGKAVEHKSQPFVTLNRVGSGKEFIYNGTQQVLVGWHKTSGGYFIRDLSG